MPQRRKALSADQLRGATRALGETNPLAWVATPRNMQEDIGPRSKPVRVLALCIDGFGVWAVVQQNEGGTFWLADLDGRAVTLYDKLVPDLERAIGQADAKIRQYNKNKGI